MRAADVAQATAAEAANAHVTRCRTCRADDPDGLPVLCDVTDEIFAPAIGALGRAWLEDL